jgi:hypothetical protein
VNDENLVDLRTRSPRERREISSKGGKVRSPKKQWARRLTAMRKKGLTDDNYKRIVAWMDEPESSALDIFMYLESIKKHCHSASQMNAVANTQINLMKAHHGEKHKTENVHHIINWTDKLKDAEIRFEETD